MDPSPPFHLHLFGSPELAEASGAPLRGRASHRHRLALLALLARSPGGVGRDVLIAYLWPDRDADQARNLLKVSVYVLRQELGDGAIVSAGDSLRLAPDIISVDMLAFEAALARGDLEAALRLHRAPFLEGFFLKDAPEFEHWLDRERKRLSDAYAAALESQAEDAERRGRQSLAIESWTARAAHDPFDSRVALRLMRALGAAGNRAGAVRHGTAHVRLLADELAMEAPAELRALMERLRSEPDAVPAAPVAEPDAETAPPPEGISGASVPTVAAPRRARWRWAALAATPLVAAALILALPRARGAADATTAPDASPPTANVAAWDLYRRASQPDVLRSDSASQRALVMFREAVELDPGFAAAYAGLARLHLRVGPPEVPDMPRAERVALAREHAERAIRLDDGLAEAHGTLGIAEMSLFRFAEAEAHLVRALELDPRGGATREWLVHLYFWMGRFDDALEQAELALELSPLSPSARAEVGRALLMNGRCDEALAVLAPLAELEPPLLRAGPITAQCLGQAGRWDEAVAQASRGIASSGAHGKAFLGYNLARAGRREEANAVLAELIENSRRVGGEAFWVAHVYAGLGDPDEAFAWLDRAVTDYSINHEIREPIFASLHTDPRFQALMERVALRGR